VALGESVREVARIAFSQQVQSMIWDDQAMSALQFAVKQLIATIDSRVVG
jgi:hypothetical protein